MNKWVIDVNAKLNNHRKGRSQEEECKRKRSIYKLPPLISDLSKKAYQPQVVSFGPYHYGESHLMPMEDHKQRALLHLLDRSQVSLGRIFKSIVKVAQELKDSYDSLERKWQDNSDEFVQLMIMDGCFMLELLRVAYHSENYYSHDDPVFSRHGDIYIMPFIKFDMLLLENQLPMLLLVELKRILDNAEPDIEDLNKSILWLLSYDNRSYPQRRECLHVLDLYRKSLLDRDNEHRNAAPQSTNQREGDYKKIGNEWVGHNVVRPATELHEAGVRFMESKRKSIQDITFSHGVLKLPNFIVDDDTQSRFLNLIAFERCHVPAGNDITSFVGFMDMIIDNDQDIKLLSSKGIIDNHIGSDKEAAELFNTMPKDMIMEMTDKLSQVHNELIDYCNKPRHKWRAYLTQTYFKSPWSIISFIAACLLFILTILQTVYTIRQYHN